MFSEKFDKIEIVLKTPGALHAWLKGCPLDLYRMMSRLRSMEIIPRTILDIGAYRGFFARTANNVFPEAFIYAFEPLKDYFEELYSLKTKLKKFECYNLALGERDGVTVIHRSSFGGSSSLLKMDKLHKTAFPATAEGQLEKVLIKTLDSVLMDKFLEKPILMKIDVQGYEKFVLNGAFETLKQVDFIICEMSLLQLYQDQELFDKLYKQITNYGFKFAGPLAELQHPVTKAVLQIDGLFIRNQ